MSETNNTRNKKKKTIFSISVPSDQEAAFNAALEILLRNHDGGFVSKSALVVWGVLLAAEHIKNCK